MVYHKKNENLVQERTGIVSPGSMTPISGVLTATQHQSTPVRFSRKTKNTSIWPLSTHRIKKKANTPSTECPSMKIKNTGYRDSSIIIAAFVEHVSCSAHAKWRQQDNRRAPSSVQLMEWVRCGATERRRMLSSAQPLQPCLPRTLLFSRRKGHLIFPSSSFMTLSIVPHFKDQEMQRPFLWYNCSVITWKSHSQLCCLLFSDYNMILNTQFCFDANPLCIF